MCSKRRNECRYRSFKGCRNSEVPGSVQHSPNLLTLSQRRAENCHLRRKSARNRLFYTDSERLQAYFKRLTITHTTAFLLLLQRKHEGWQEIRLQTHRHSEHTVGIETLLVFSSDSDQFQQHYRRSYSILWAPEYPVWDYPRVEKRWREHKSYLSDFWHHRDNQQEVHLRVLKVNATSNKHSMSLFWFWSVGLRIASTV